MKSCINNRKKLVKQQYLLHTSPQYGELSPLTAEMRSGVWGTPENFNGVRLLASYCSDVAQQKSTKLCMMFGRLLGWGGHHLCSEGYHHVGHRPTLYFV